MIVPSAAGEDYAALGGADEACPVVAWQVDEGSGRVTAAVGVGLTSSVVELPDGGVVDLSSGERWEGVVAWRRSLGGAVSAGAGEIAPGAITPGDQGAIELEAVDQSPPRPTLTPEWRLRVVTPGGAVTFIPVDSEASGVEVGKRLKHSTWAIERRMVGPWVAVVQPVRTVVSLEPAESPGGFNGQGA